MDRRRFPAGAAALGITGVWAMQSAAGPLRTRWREDRNLYPQGVASGDPDEHSIVLWTRRPFEAGSRHVLTPELALDAEFSRVVATARVPVLAAADWTCRALVGGLLPATTYWYRSDEVPHRYSRTVCDLGRIPDGRKVGNVHVPTNLIGYRHIYRAHIDDPDIQDARAYLPFVCMGDNHEFSWQGWQSFTKYPGSGPEPAQPLRAAANQASGSISLHAYERHRAPVSISSARPPWRKRLRNPSTITALAPSRTTVRRSAA